MDSTARQQDLLFRNWRGQFADLIRSAKHELILCAPYISMTGADCIKSATQGVCRELRCLLLTDLSSKHIASGSTDPEAVKAIACTLPNAEIFHLPRLHAKVYIADRSRSVVTSGNLTAGGLISNFECGILIQDPAKSAVLGAQIEDYSRLGAKILEEQLIGCCAISRELKTLTADADVSRSYSAEVATKIEAIDEILLTRRLASGPVHGIFSETILYLLRRNGPMTTASLHEWIAQIHPDLCDNSIDRIIDGKRFGKKWKHAVRTAQQHLKKSGMIHLVGQEWKLTDYELIAEES